MKQMGEQAGLASIPVPSPKGPKVPRYRVFQESEVWFGRYLGSSYGLDDAYTRLDLGLLGALRRKYHVKAMWALCCLQGSEYVFFRLLQLQGPA